MPEEKTDQKSHQEEDQKTRLEENHQTTETPEEKTDQKSHQKEDQKHDETYYGEPLRKTICLPNIHNHAVVAHIDSGSKHNICFDKHLMHNLKQCSPMEFKGVGNTCRKPAILKGTMTLPLIPPLKPLQIPDTYYCPDIPYLLVSVHGLSERGYTCVFTPTQVQIQQGEKTIARGEFQ